MPRAHIKSDYLRSIVFGCEDGLVSTTGSVVGIGAGSGDSQVVILAGLVIVAVESISMGAGEFLSERAVHELDGHGHNDSPLVAGLLMLASYIVAGFIPILPFLLLELEAAMAISLLLAFVSLFLLGYVKARITKVDRLRSGLEILVVGGLATIIGVAVGLLLKVA